MRILITGGAGFIGSHIVDGCLADGHDVAVLDNFTTGFRENVHPRATVFEADIRDTPGVRQALAEFRPDVISHHAAQMDVRKSLEDPLFDAETNILGSLRLILEALRHGVKRIIYASTGGAVYGDPETLPVAETHAVKPECAYGISKHTVEHYLELYRKLGLLNFTVLRYANVYGPRQNPHGEAGVNAIFIGRMLGGSAPTIFGTGEQLRDYVYIADVVNANRLALTRGDGWILNIGTGVGTSVVGIYETLASILHFSGDPIFAPERTGEIDRVYLDATLAREVLGWRPEVTLRDGLQQTVNWFREQTASRPSPPVPK